MLLFFFHYFYLRNKHSAFSSGSICAFLPVAALTTSNSAKYYEATAVNVCTMPSWPWVLHERSSHIVFLKWEGFMELLGGILVRLDALEKAAVHRKTLCLNGNCCAKHNHRISKETNNMGRAMFIYKASKVQTTLWKGNQCI